jgi:hypothetical protein
MDFLNSGSIPAGAVRVVEQNPKLNPKPGGESFESVKGLGETDVEECCGKSTCCWSVVCREKNRTIFIFRNLQI